MEARSRWFGLQGGNYVGGAAFLSKGQACRGILPKEDLPDQKCRRLGCRRWWSMQDSTHRHSQMQRLLFWTVFTVALGANEARREGPAWCVRVCQHRRPDERQRLEPSEVDEWLVKRHRTERRCSSQLDWRWMQQPGFAERLLPGSDCRMLRNCIVCVLIVLELYYEYQTGINQGVTTMRPMASNAMIIEAIWLTLGYKSALLRSPVWLWMSWPWIGLENGERRDRSVKNIILMT